MTAPYDIKATGSASVDSGNNHARLQEDIDSITKRLQSSSSELNPTQLLLQRAQAYADLGNEAGAQSDIAQAASLVKDPEHATPENISAVERAFRNISIAGKRGSLSRNSLADKRDEELVDAVVDKATPASFGSDLVDILHALEARVEQKKKPLESGLLSKLVDTFHRLFSDEKQVAEGKDKDIRALASCISSCFSVSSGTKGMQEEKQSMETHAMLSDILSRILGAWRDHENDGWFKQRACQYGASMYASAIHALATTSKIDASTELPHVSGALGEAYAFFVNQIWLVGTLPIASPAEINGTIQGALRLLTTHHPLFVYQFTSASQRANDNAASPF
ncbi:hypothetical protein LPJ56_004753, partial [Coemansia sp. RSA 2599]